MKPSQDRHRLDAEWERALLALPGDEPDLRCVPPTLLDRLLDTLHAWDERAHGRQQLARMDARLLNDIGLTPERAQAEAAKPFWR